MTEDDVNDIRFKAATDIQDAVQRLHFLWEAGEADHDDSRHIVTALLDLRDRIHPNTIAVIAASKRRLEPSELSEQTTAARTADRVTAATVVGVVACLCFLFVAVLAA